MRQIGILCAAARYALSHHVARLKDDHAHAQVFARAVAASPHARVDLERVETNIVNVHLPRTVAERASASAKERGLLLNASGPSTLRAVTHLDVSLNDVERAAALLVETLHALESTP